MPDDANNIVPFGKYRGQPVEAMMADPSYCDWALSQPGLRTRFAGLFAVIVNDDEVVRRAVRVSNYED